LLDQGLSPYQALLDSGINPQELQQFRIQLIREIQAITGRPLIVYAAHFSRGAEVGQNTLNVDDKLGLADAMRGVQGTAVDVLLHSPGGSAEVAEQLAQILRASFQSVRFIIFELCKNSTKLSMNLVKGWLAQYMFKDRSTKVRDARRVAAYLCAHRRLLSHARPIGIEQCHELALEVEDLRKQPELREKVWRLYSAYQFLFDKTAAVKIYENAFGTSWMRLFVVQQVVLQQPPSAVLPMTPQPPSVTPPQT
jgi:hypothetical protein